MNLNQKQSLLYQNNKICQKTINLNKKQSVLYQNNRIIPNTINLDQQQSSLYLNNQIRPKTINSDRKLHLRMEPKQTFEHFDAQWGVESERWISGSGEPRSRELMLRACDCLLNP